MQQYFAYMSVKRNMELDIDEYRCYIFDNDDWQGITCRLACEGKGRGLGCSEIKRCPEYAFQCEFEALHKGVDFANPNNNKAAILAELRMIKKGLIKPVKTGGQLNSQVQDFEDKTEVRK